MSQFSKSWCTPAFSQRLQILSAGEMIEDKKEFESTFKNGNASTLALSVAKTNQRFFLFDVFCSVG